MNKPIHCGTSAARSRQDGGGFERVFITLPERQDAASLRDAPNYLALAGALPSGPTWSVAGWTPATRARIAKLPRGVDHAVPVRRGSRHSRSVWVTPNGSCAIDAQRRPEACAPWRARSFGASRSDAASCRSSKVMNTRVRRRRRHPGGCVLHSCHSESSILSGPSALGCVSYRRHRAA